MAHILSFDPGESSGIALGWFSKFEPYTFIKGWQPQGGAQGILDWFHEEDSQGVLFKKDTNYVSELFVLANNEFVANIESKRGEGVIMAQAYPQKVTWQDRTRKHGVPDRILKEHGMWQGGAGYSHEDGRDVNDAIIHGIEYLRTRVHVPTLKAYFR